MNYSPLSPNGPPDENRPCSPTSDGRSEADLRIQKMIVAALIGAGLLALLIVGLGVEKHAQRSTLALRQFNEGTRHYERKEYAAAEAAFREAIKNKPDEADYHYRLALSIQRQKNPREQDQAIAQVKEAIRYAPTVGKYHRALARLYDIRKRYAEAAGEGREAVRLEPDNASFHEGLAYTLFLGKHLDAARTEVLEAIRLDPKRDRYFGHLGDIDAERKEYRLAEADYRRALQIDKSEPNYHDDLAFVLRHLGKTEQANQEVASAKKLRTHAAVQAADSNDPGR